MGIDRPSVLTAAIIQIIRQPAEHDNLASGFSKRGDVITPVHMIPAGQLLRDNTFYPVYAFICLYLKNDCFSGIIIEEIFDPSFHLIPPQPVAILVFACSKHAVNQIQSLDIKCINAKPDIEIPHTCIQLIPYGQKLTLRKDP